MSELDKYIEEKTDALGSLSITDSPNEEYLKEICEGYCKIKQCDTPVISKCNSKKDTNIEKTILLVTRKDGLTDVYTEGKCLGEGLDTQGINDLKLL